MIVFKPLHKDDRKCNIRGAFVEQECTNLIGSSWEV